MFNKLYEYIDKIECIIKSVNELNKTKAADKLVSIQKRVDLLFIGMTLIEKAQNEILQYKEFNSNFDREKVINLDYKISELAGKFYKASSFVIDIFANVRKSKKVNSISKDQKLKFIELTKRILFISARWDIERMINVFEFDVPPQNKAFEKRKPLLSTCIFFANRMNATKLGITFEDGIMPRRIIFAVQPNAGKSFIVNVYSVMAIMLHALYYNTSGILRMSNNLDNACGFSNQIKAMIENEKIADIYPEVKKFFKNQKCRILEKSTSEEWKLNGLDPRIRASHFARGRESAINSIRVFVLLAIDDLSDGFEQMNNDEAHKAMTTKYEIDMDSRKEEANVPEFIAGTMFNEYDVPNTLIRKLEERGLLIDSTKFKNVRHTKDYSTVVIAMDCFDENGESVAPKLISTEKLKEKQNSLKSYEFDLVYRQIRSSREPRVFEYQNLKTYTKMPDDLSFAARGYIDPTRKQGRDYFAFPVFRHRDADNLEYFVNCIYEKKSLGKTEDPQNKFLEKVVNFIIDNRIVDFTIENNTSNTIGTIIDMKLKEKGYNFCKIKEIYTAKIKQNSTKMQRILDQEATIVNNVCFPAPGVFPPKHPMTEFMDHFTRYDVNVNYNNIKNHDDAPDSICGFSMNYLFVRKNRYSIISGIDKEFLLK